MSISVPKAALHAYGQTGTSPPSLRKYVKLRIRVTPINHFIISVLDDSKLKSDWKINVMNHNNCSHIT